METPKWGYCTSRQCELAAVADPLFGPFLLTGLHTAQQSIVVAAAPEPGTWLLPAGGLAGALVRRRL
jgi:hypothetical protein